MQLSLKDFERRTNIYHGRSNGRWNESVRRSKGKMQKYDGLRPKGIKFVNSSSESESSILELSKVTRCHSSPCAQIAQTPGTESDCNSHTNGSWADFTRSGQGGGPGYDCSRRSAQEGRKRKHKHTRERESRCCRPPAPHRVHHLLRRGQIQFQYRMILRHLRLQRWCILFLPLHEPNLRGLGRRIIPISKSYC